MFCPNCGNEIKEEDVFCQYCGSKNPNYNLNASQREGETDYTNFQKQNDSVIESETSRCLPAFIVGLIGSILGIFGGLCVSMCDTRTGGNAPFVLIFGGSVIGMVGACQCLKRVKRGAVLQLIAAVMIIICAYGITGADLMSVFAFVLLLAGGIIGILKVYVFNK